MTMTQKTLHPAVSVTILAFDSVLATALTGINDLLCMTGVTWNQLNKQPVSPNFNVQIASTKALPIQTQYNVSISAHCAIEDVTHSDIYLVPAIAGDIEKALANNPAIIKLLKTLDPAKCLIGGNSAGAFFLAEAGLLNGKVATTHWAVADLFRQKYPQVNLKADQVITHDQNIICNSGGMAWFDFGLYLVETFCGHETAMRTSKVFIAETGGPNKLTFSPLIGKKYHNDKIVLKIQDWMENNYTSSVAIGELGEQFGLSSRSLIRRFNSTTGMSPSGYLQAVRADSACKLLVQTDKTVADITLAVGYEDVSSFCKFFKDKTGLSPSSYRARFK